MKHKFLKLAGVKTEKEFYDKYPDEASFFKAFPKAQKGLAVTPEQQYEGLNNPRYTEMEFPMQGNNVFRGLDNGQPVLLKDSTGKQKILTGPQDTTIMKGTVKEKRIKAQKGTSIDLKKKAIHTVEGRYSGLQGNDSPTLLESIKGNIDYFKNNQMPGTWDPQKNSYIDSNVYRPEFMHHSITEVPIVPIAKCGKSVKGKMKKAQGGINIWDTETDIRGNKPIVPINPDARPVVINPDYNPNQQPQFIDQGITTPMPTTSLLDKNAAVSKPSVYNNNITQPINVLPKQQEKTKQTRYTAKKDELQQLQKINGLLSSPTAPSMAATSWKFDIPKAQGGFITQEEQDRRLWGNQNVNPVPVNPNNPVPQANPNYEPDRKPEFIDQGKGNPIPTSSVQTGSTATIKKGMSPYNGQAKFDMGKALGVGMNIASMILGPEGERRRVDNTLAYNPYAYGTGSQAIAKKGKSIKPSHQGQGLMTYEGGNAPKVSENMFDGGTHLFTGDSHEKGGIMSSFNGQPFEAEGGEPFAKIEGKGVVFGDLVNPLTGRTYKKDAKEIMKKELKISKYLDKGTELVNEKDPTDKFERLAFNSGRAMMEGAATKLKQIADSKAHLAELQEAQLEIEGEEAFAKHGKVIKAQSGVTAPARPVIEGSEYALYPNALEGLARKVADEVGLDPNLFHKVVTQESQYNPKAESRPNRRTGENALGLAMLTPKVAKEYGLSKKDLVDDSFEGYSKNLFAGATELKKRIDKYNGDIKLGLLDYNGGEGAVASARRNAKKQGLIKTDSEFTGDIGVTALSNKRKKRGSTNPDLWEVQSVEYVNNIMDADEAAFPQKAASFNRNFYQQPTPDFTLPTPQLKGLTPEEIAAMDSKKPNVPNQPAKGSDPYEWQKVEPWKINPTKDKLELSQIMGETAALFDRPDFVEGQRYNPDLYTPYQVSFQDRINQNSKTFNALQSTMAGNPEALATMAGQQYSANDAVLAEEFRTNQAISNDITNKNVALLNDAKLKNISLIDQQYVRQNQAKSITKQNRTNALNSISSKILQKKASNNLLNTYKNLFPHYDFDNNYQVVKQGPGGEQYVIIPTQIGTNPFAVTDKKTQTTYGPDGEKKSEKVTTDPSYIRDKGYLDLEKLRKQIANMTFNGSIIKQYKGTN